MNQIFKSLFLCFGVLVATVGCSPEKASDAYSVWVTILPQKFLVERIVGEAFQVEVLLRPGQSPEAYSPSAAELARVSKATLYFGIGVPVEAPILRRLESSMTGVTFVQTGDAVDLAHVHDHVHGEHCVHGENDPHIWLNPIRMIEAVEMMTEALCAASPEFEDVFRANADLVTAELRDTDERIRSALAPYAGRGFFINHPSLGHYAERYGLVQHSIEHAGSAPSARRVADLVKLARAEGVGVILTQPEFGRSSADVLARELKIDVIEVDPLAGSYLENLWHITESIVKGFRNE